MHDLTLKIPAKAQSKLLTLKRFTGIKHWNVLARWAFAASLAEPTPPSPALTDTLGGPVELELSFKRFAGALAPIYLALLKERCQRDGLDTQPHTLQNQLLLHVLRGALILTGDRNIRSIEALLERAIQ